MINQVITETLYNGFSFEMIYVEGSTFKMGSRDEEALDREKPIHFVTLDSFYIGKYAVTQELWKAVMGADNNPAYTKDDNRPVEMVSWDDAHGFIRKLNKACGMAYRLLTEAEWEYAARGGRKSRGYKYGGSNNLKDVGWYGKYCPDETKPVGLKYSNELGLYDMSGNVREWCQDWYAKGYYEKCNEKGIINNPTGPEKGAIRVVRGGSWGNLARFCRVAHRGFNAPSDWVSDLGFRLGLSI